MLVAAGPTNSEVTTIVQQTFWNLVAPILRRIAPFSPSLMGARAGGRVSENAIAQAPPVAPHVVPRARANPRAAKHQRPKRPARSSPRQRQYDEVVRLMLHQHAVRVRKWRSSMSGVAWQLKYTDGRLVNLIESPRPKGPMSIAIFLHEIGHHAIGFNRYKPRCLEEYHAWMWSLGAMEHHGLSITDAVRHRVALSLWYAVSKARRRGLHQLPVELEPYQHRPVRRRAHATEMAA